MNNANSKKSETNEYTCPICGTILNKIGIKYKTEELLNLWSDVVFSEVTRNEHYKQSNYTSLHKCGNCDLEIYFPQVIGTPNFYLELQEFIYPFYTDKWEFEMAKSDVKRDYNVIDIGCGHGIFLKKINEKVSRAIGIEYNQNALIIAREKGLEVFGSEEDVSDLLGKMDIVFCFHVLEHVKDPIEFMYYLCEFLKDNGRIGISVPNMDGPVKYTDPNKWNMPPHHATRWNIKSLKKMAFKIGLKIENIKYEPLSYESSDYYSMHWINKNVIFGDTARFVTSKIFKMFFWVLFSVFRLFNKKYISMLYGQSVYILLQKT